MGYLTDDGHIGKYIALMRERPDDFADSDTLPIERDPELIAEFERRTGKRCGVIDDNSPYYYLLGDVVGRGERAFRYPRLLHCNTGSAGGICLVHNAEADTFLFERIFRHGCRKTLLELPRGFHENAGLTAEENIRKELGEELGLTVGSVRRLGRCLADSSFIGVGADVFAAEIDDTAVAPSREEGITGAEWFTRDQVRQMLGREIVDSFSLSAWALYNA